MGTYILRKGHAVPSDLKDVTVTVNELNDLDVGLRSVVFDDFLGTWAVGDTPAVDIWLSTKGSGQATAVAVAVANALGGAITVTSSDLDAGISANASNIGGVNLGYKANQGGLSIEARIKIDDISEAYFFLGFTDVLGSTVEAPIFLVTTAIDSDATDACGIAYDVDGTTEEFFHGGVKNGTDTAPVYSGGAPAQDVYAILRVEVSSAGAVQGFIDGVAIGNPVANAITNTVAVTPMLVIANRSANPVIVTVDYIKVQQNR